MWRWIVSTLFKGRTKRDRETHDRDFDVVLDTIRQHQHSIYSWGALGRRNWKAKPKDSHL